MSSKRGDNVKQIVADPDYAEFLAWKRARDKSGFDEAFFLLEQSLTNPAGREFNCIMPSKAYRLLAEALMALKKRVTDE